MQVRRGSPLSQVCWSRRNHNLDAFCQRGHYLCLTLRVLGNEPGSGLQCRPPAAGVCCTIRFIAKGEGKAWCFVLLSSRIVCIFRTVAGSVSYHISVQLVEHIQWLWWGFAAGQEVVDAVSSVVQSSGKSLNRVTLSAHFIFNTYWHSTNV